MPYCLKCNQYFNVGEQHDHNKIKGSSPRRIPFSDEIEFVEPSQQPFRRISPKSPRRIIPSTFSFDEIEPSQQPFRRISPRRSEIVSYIHKKREYSPRNDQVDMHDQLFFSSGFQCDVCHRKFANAGNFVMHLKTHSKLKFHKKKSYECDICGKTFKGITMYESHVTVHTGDKPFICSVCNKRFSRKGNLKTHLNSVHFENTFPHICNVCDFVFPTRKDFYTHTVDIHPEEFPHICNVCDKRFSYKGNLDRHQKSHIESHTCHICNKQFKGVNSLQRHYERKHRF